MPASERCSGQLLETLLHAWAEFRQELGKECDSNHAVREVELNSSAKLSDLSYENSFRSSDLY